MPLPREGRYRDAADYLAPLVGRHLSLDSARVVEFGCGTGPVAEAFARCGASVLGVEILAEDVERGRALLAGEPNLDVELFAGSFEELLERVEAERGRVDAFLFPAVLEHMTSDERRAALRLARDVLRPGGLVAVFETPNRLLPWDHHTTMTPFFHLLPDDVALEWLPRVHRQEIAEQVLAAEDPDGRRLALARAGRGVSFHEFALAWPQGWTVLDGGYDPALAPIRLVHPEERFLASMFERMGLYVHPAFSRYWLDMILRPERTEHASRVWRPIPFEAIGQAGAGVTRWGTLLLAEQRAAVPINHNRPFDAIVMGVEPRMDAAQRVDIVGVESVVVSAQPSTHYATVELPAPADRAVLAAGTPGVALSHLAVREHPDG